MSMYNKVVWSEGMFIRPQHFQQQERYLSYLLYSQQQLHSAYYWGFTHYTFNQGLLAIGKLGLEQAGGILPDGTVFSCPAEDMLPPALDIDETVRDQIVYLGLPVARNGLTEVAINQPHLPLARANGYDATAEDAASTSCWRWLCSCCCCCCKFDSLSTDDGIDTAATSA